jgi:hypothetical protein
VNARTMLPRALLATLASSIALASTPARAQAVEPDAPPPLPLPEQRPFVAAPASRVDGEGTWLRREAPEAMWRFELGYRGNFVTDAGFGPFSTRDYLGQISLAASRTLFVAGRFSFASGIAWDFGENDATVRGDKSSLQMSRLEVPLEGRVHFGRWGYALLRAAPGVALENLEVDDASLSSPLTKTRWLFAADVSGGYAFPIWTRQVRADHTPQIWVQADGGYGWVVAQRLDLTPDGSSGSGASGVDLGTLTMRGAFVRVAAAVSF